VSFDNVCKVLAEKYPREFVSWLLAEAPTKVKVLKTELSLEPIRADSVTFLQTANRISNAHHLQSSASIQDAGLFSEVNPAV